MDSAANAMRDFTEDVRRQVIDVGLRVSYDPRLAQAVLTEDTQEILRVGRQLIEDYGITYITVSDTNFIILARTDEPERSRDVSRTVPLEDALSGTISVAYSPVGIRQIPIRASVPLFYEGEIIGAVVVGYALDTQKAVDALRNRHDAEFTFFRETNGRHYRISSTLTDERNNSVVGTYITDAYLLRTVFQQRQEWVGSTTLFGNDYIATYIPFYDPYGDALGIVFMGFSMDEIVAQRTSVIVMVVLIGIVGLAIALAVLYLISGSIVAPIKNLAAIVSGVSRGKTNINKESNLPNDEIGSLTKDVYGLVDVIKNMVQDVAELKRQFSVVGDIE